MSDCEVTAHPRGHCYGLFTILVSRGKKEHCLESKDMLCFLCIFISDKVCERCLYL